MNTQALSTQIANIFSQPSSVLIFTIAVMITLRIWWWYKQMKLVDEATEWFER